MCFIVLFCQAQAYSMGVCLERNKIRILLRMFRDLGTREFFLKVVIRGWVSDIF